MAGLNDWPLWKRVVFTNATCAGGVAIAFYGSHQNVAIEYRVYAAAGAFVLMNFMWLVVSPRVASLKRAGLEPPSAWGVAYQVIKERPFVTALAVIQFAMASQALATSVAIWTTAFQGHDMLAGSAALLVACITALWIGRGLDFGEDIDGLGGWRWSSMDCGQRSVQFSR